MSQHRLEPETVTCDFEKGLMKAIDQQFPRGKINGCLFHWKQAIRRKMLSLKIDQEYVGHAMTKNCIDILTIIPRDEILVKGIPYVRSILEAEDLNLSSDDCVKWDVFWIYFKSFWCSSLEFIATWNIKDVDDKNRKMQNRTNNALESYNRFFA